VVGWSFKSKWLKMADFRHFWLFLRQKNSEMATVLKNVISYSESYSLRYNNENRTMVIRTTHSAQKYLFSSNMCKKTQK